MKSKRPIKHAYYGTFDTDGRLSISPLGMVEKNADPDSVTLGLSSVPTRADRKWMRYLAECLLGKQLPPEVPMCRLYRTLWITSMGYVVYRMCFDVTKCTVEEGARAHKQAVFVDEQAAIDYCIYRNALVELNGSDALPERHGWRPGEHFTMQQAAAKRTGFTRRHPRYPVHFVIADSGLPKWTGAGVKPREETLEAARRYVVTGTMDE